MKKLILFILMSLSIPALIQAQHTDKTMNVAIFVHNGVELFDFAGPGEVFASANYFTDVVGFNVYTVAPSEEEVVSQTFLKINPNYSIDNCPDPDIIVLPGGQTGIPMKNPKVMAWIEKHSSQTELMLSVCTGAFLLAKADLLNGLRATTHHSSYEGLRKYEAVTVLEEPKFIDSGNIITSGGVSSGTEGALHVISRVAGVQAAKRVARYMEYDHWSEEIGLMDSEHKVLTTIRKNGLNGQKERLMNAMKGGQTPIYFGELDKIARTLFAKGETEKAIAIFENNMELFPSYESSSSLKYAYAESGRKTPLMEDDFKEIVEGEGFETMVKKLRKEQKKFPGWKLYQEHSMYMLGYQYKSEEKYEYARIAFELNTENFPGLWHNYNALGEIYMKLGNSAMARESYEKAIELNPDNDKLKEALASIQ